jgi:SAM-dependent methyltransferase
VSEAPRPSRAFHGLGRLLPRRLRREVVRWVREKSAETAAETIAPAEARIAELEARVARAAASVTELDTALQQVLTLLRREANIPPPPPKHLQERVVGGYVPGFLESGYEVCRELDAALAPAGRTLSDFRRILDFGCGSGRATRALKALHPRAELSGTDIDEEAIAWLAWNYPAVARFTVAPHRPPTSYADGAFDFVFGISVFTHLPQDMEREWLDELRRIAAPGAHLVLTTHGETHWGKLAPEIRAVVERDGFYYGDFGVNYGRSIQLPDFYQTAYHSHDYVRREWGKRFEVLAITPLGMGRHQDTVLLRKPA